MAERSDRIVETLTDAFADLMAADPTAFRTKFRSMAQDPFAFYRGTACLFYADIAGDGPVRRRRRRLGRRRGRAPGLDPGRPARRELRHLPRRRRPAGLRRQRLRRGLRRALDLGPVPVLCLARPAGLAEGPARREHRRPGRDLRPRPTWTGCGHYVDAEDDTEWALTLASARGGVLDALHQARLRTRVALLDRARWWTTTTAGSPTAPGCGGWTTRRPSGSAPPSPPTWTRCPTTRRRGS